jgi:nucleotide-binding universal stress UspA family protein
MSFEGGLKTIVVAASLDGRSEAALEYARKLAGAYDARLVLAHGVDPVAYAAVGELTPKIRAGMTEEVSSALKRLADELTVEGIRNHTEIHQGEIAEMLLRVARQYDAGLIVLGTDGLDGAGAYVVGAVAEQLVRLAPCPVLAVAADWNAGPYRPTPGGPILLAIEKNEALSAASATALSLAQTFNRPLHIVHARSAAEAMGFLNPSATRPEDFGIFSTGSVKVDCLVKDGTPADVIGEAIAQLRPSILVVGVKRSSETPGPHGTAFTLLARSRVPVICVPPALKPVAAQ